MNKIIVHPIYDLTSFKGTKVYIASPLSAPTQEGIHENAVFARMTSDEIMKMYPNVRAIAPHGYLPLFLDDNDPAEREIALKFGMDVLELCDAICCCGERLSTGMKAEVISAYEAGKTIFATENLIPSVEDLLASQ